MQWRKQKISMGGFHSVAYGVHLICGVRCFWRHNFTSYLCFQFNVLAKFVDTIYLFFYNTRTLLILRHYTKYKLSAVQARISEENTLDGTTQQFITANISGCALKQRSTTYSSLRQSNLQRKNQAALIYRRIRALSIGVRLDRLTHALVCKIESC